MSENYYNSTLTAAQIEAVLAGVNGVTGLVKRKADGTFEEGSEVYWATYGVSTNAEIETAYQAGRPVACKYNSKIYYLSSRDYSTPTHTFAALLTTNIDYISVTSNVWSAERKSLQLTSGKVITLSEQSTDAQYPSAKCVYDALLLKADAGEGVPTGGTTGQILAKHSDTDYDTEWIDPPDTQIQADWDQTDTTAKDYIKNKPTVPEIDATLTTTGKAADAKVTGDKVGELKSTIDGITTGESFSFALDTTWSQGGVNQEGEYSSWSRIRTDYVDISVLGQITLSPASGYVINYVLYNSSKQITRYGTWVASATLDIASNEKYIRVQMREDPEANLSPSAGSNLSATAVYKIAQDVKVSTDAIKDMESFSISDLVWGKGGISAGANYNTNSKIRSSYSGVSQYTRLTAEAPTGYKYNIVFYNSSKTYLFTAPSAGYTTGKKVFKLDNAIAYIRVCFSKDPEEDVSDTSMSSNFSLSADWKLPGEVKNETEKTDLMSSMTWIRGTLDDDGNYISSTSRVVTDSYLSVSGLKSIEIEPLNDLVKYRVIFYGDNGRISATPVNFTDKQIITIPANVTKIKMTLINNPDAWIADGTMGKSIRVYAGFVLTNDLDGNQTIRDYFVATSVNKKEILPLESGKTIIAIGDSITAATGSTGWTYHLSQMTGVSIVNKAVGGATFGESVSDSGHRISTQITNVTDAQWESADLVIVAAGTNDYQHETPLDELKEKVQADITAIKAKTNKPIVFITPIRRGLAVNNVIILKIAMISGIIANVALANQCNVICGYDFPIPTYNINGLIDVMTQSDALHPNAYGANVYARSVINALM